jgi:hypothetical protein
MTDAQILAIGITVLAVLAGTLFSNSRIGDLSTRVSETNNASNRRIDDLKEVLRAEMKAGFSSAEHKLDELLRITAHQDDRIIKLEERSR